MREYRARSRSTRAIFFPIFSHSSSCYVTVWLPVFYAAKCGKANKSSRKCAGKKYFLSEDIARAAELQVGSTVCRVHWDEIRREPTGARFLEEIIREASGKSEFLQDLLLFWIRATRATEQHVQTRNAEVDPCAYVLPRCFHARGNIVHQRTGFHV